MRTRPRHVSFYVPWQAPAIPYDTYIIYRYHKDSIYQQDIYIFQFGTPIGPKSAIRAIESVQYKASNIVPSLRSTPYEARLKSLKQPTLVHRRNREDQIMFGQKYHKHR